MTKQFATGKHSIAFCDRCARKVMYTELHEQIVNMKPTGLRVCDECLDQDHPQWQVGLWPINDPQALANPRPENFIDPEPLLTEDEAFILGTETGAELITES